MKNFKEQINKITDSENPSSWKEKAQARRSKPWLKQYSSQIARRILAIIGDREDLSQAKLAEALQVSPQQISKIVKGQENLTLETIYKLSKALDTELISFPQYKYSYVTKTFPPFNYEVNPLQKAVTFPENLSETTHSIVAGTAVIKFDSMTRKFG
ncbi:helix-turn-helix transcriptional regulator [Terrimonas sp. NA20]|uniref:Helix-turn-helix transcriptional regulator n=1 Tax=Terrimonas ginsenosidimutans TaxID=2908004 RepID=A0ABS9KKF1_9BACT|nr:helix-turn-helix transcriptional regulator [Terrimonas ginsenosidimutans]MCG2612804.1 helix-turn-helix transcriptional regulator [Terrimonas ginsenosidimutans]